MFEPIAIPFKYRNDKYNDMALEFNIEFYSSENKLKDLIVFCKTYKDRLINISFPEGIDKDVIETMSEMFDNVRIRLMISDVISVDFLKEKNIPFFFDWRCAANSHGMLAALIKLGVTDVYVSDDLCYDMDNVKLICKSHNVRLRCVLNHIPNYDIFAGDNPKSTIYLPQDIDTLKNYFDVFEFDVTKDEDNKLDVLYRTFFLQKKWNGPLVEINKDISSNMQLDDNFIYPNFTSYKLNCGRRCDSRAGSTCRKCEGFMKMHDILKNKHIRIK